MAKTAAQPKTMESNHKVASVLSTGLFAILCVLIAFPLLAGFFASFQEGREVVMKGMSLNLDFSKMEEQFGDKRVVPFSFSTDPESVQKEQISCWLTYTNEKTHEIIRNNLDRSPLFSGAIEGTGPRYCPSIEDKVVKFAEKERHQIFIEAERGKIIILGNQKQMNKALHFTLVFKKKHLLRFATKSLTRARDKHFFRLDFVLYLRSYYVAGKPVH